MILRSGGKRRRAEQSMVPTGAARIPQVLTIAGSDPGGGAGIQADIKVFSMQGTFALSVITAITIQNTKGVTAVREIPLPTIEAQINAVFSDFKISAVKTGMLSSGKVVRRVAALLKAKKIKNLVVDPVILSTNGYPLLNRSGIQYLRSDLIPLAALVTPNIHEAEVLSGFRITSLADMEEAARAIFTLGCQAVLIKGGHLKANPGVDILYYGKAMKVFPGKYIRSRHTHGTGCVYSAAIAAQLAHGEKLEAAIKKSKDYITETIQQGLPIGRGKGPVNPVLLESL